MSRERLRRTTKPLRIKRTGDLLFVVTESGEYIFGEGIHCLPGDMALASKANDLFVELKVIIGLTVPSLDGRHFVHLHDKDVVRIRALIEACEYGEIPPQSADAGIDGASASS